MKLEIKIKCPGCDNDATFEMLPRVTLSFSKYYLATLKSLCPICHPAEPENITPENGEAVEVRVGSGIALRYTSGGRSLNGCITVAVFRDAVVFTSVKQWRYLGEKEWRT